jgi:hypothetical protein
MMNRTLVLTLMAGTLSAGIAFAQSAATNDSTKPPAVSTGDAASKTSQAPVAGKNSFTMDQAETRLRDHGYTAVKGLTKDDQGVWRGSAMKGEKSVTVSVDYQGNITDK